MAKDAEKLEAQAQRIRELRKFARVSQETVAGKVGVTLRAYQRWERGEGEINSENIKKLARYFSTTPDYIEYGAMEREATPDPFADGTLDGRLARMEEKLDRLLAANGHNGLTAQEHDHLEKMEDLIVRLSGLLPEQAPAPPAPGRHSPRAGDQPAA